MLDCIAQWHCEFVIDEFTDAPSGATLDNDLIKSHCILYNLCADIAQAAAHTHTSESQPTQCLDRYNNTRKNKEKFHTVGLIYRRITRVSVWICWVLSRSGGTRSAEGAKLPHPVTSQISRQFLCAAATTYFVLAKITENILGASRTAPAGSRARFHLSASPGQSAAYWVRKRSCVANLLFLRRMFNNFLIKLSAGYNRIGYLTVLWRLKVHGYIVLCWL